MSEDQNEDYYNTLFSNLAVNKLFRVCYKQMAGKNRAFSSQEHESVYVCHDKLLDAFKIVLPSIIQPSDDD